MLNWVWDQPINGWEFILTTVLGIITTVASVVIGLRYALRGEAEARSRHLQDKLERENEGVAIGVALTLRDEIRDALGTMTMGFVVAHAASTNLREKHWRPAKVRAAIAKARLDMPESHMAVVDYIAHIFESAERSIDSFDLREGIEDMTLMQFIEPTWTTIRDDLTGFAEKTRPLSKFYWQPERDH